MIKARNGLIACQALQEVAQEVNATPGFKGRDEKKGLLCTTVVYGAPEYPAGTKVWVKKVDRLPYDEYQLSGQTVVMVRVADVLLAEFSDAQTDQTDQKTCLSPHHKKFIHFPYCAS